MIITIATCLMIVGSNPSFAVSGTIYITDCEYMPNGVIATPLVITLQSTMGYPSCPATHVTNDWDFEVDIDSDPEMGSGGATGTFTRTTVHYSLIFEIHRPL